jgi:O-antigen/teichoic acid export membrane protein
MMPADIRNIVSDAKYSTLRSAVALGRTVAIVPVITKIAGSETYGLWAAAYAVFLILLGLGNGHLHGALLRYLPREGRYEQAYIDLLLLSAWVGILLIPVLGVIGPILFGGINETSYGIPLWAGVTLAIVPRLPLLIEENYPRAYGRIDEYELVQILRLSMETVVLVGIFYFLGDVVLAFVGLAATYGIMVCLLLVLYQPSPARPSISRYSTYLRYSLPMLPKQIGQQTVNSIDRYLVVYFLTSTIGGAYAAAYLLPSLLKKFNSVLNPTLYPTIIQAWDEDDLDEIEMIYENLFRWYTVLIIPAVVGLTLTARPALRLLSTSEIASRGWIVVPVIGVGFLAYGYGDLAVYVLNAAEETSRIALANVVAGAMNLLLNITLIPIVGIIGAAAASTISFSVMSVILLWDVNRFLTISVPWISLFRSLVSSLVMAGVILLIPGIQSDVITLVVLPPIGILTYLLSLLAIGGVTWDELRENVGGVINL